MSQRMLFCFPRLCISSTTSEDVIVPKTTLQKALYEDLYESDDEPSDGIDVNNLPPVPSKYDMQNTMQFVPPVTEGYVIKVYDGDTITIASKLPYPNSPMYRFHVRLNGIDTPEIKGKTDDEKDAARKVQKILENLILHKSVKLKKLQTEKYGRILADIHLKDLHVNQWLLDNHYAVKYDGGKKTSPPSWSKYINYGPNRLIEV